MMLSWIADHTAERMGGAQFTDQTIIEYLSKFYSIDRLGLFNIENLTNPKAYLKNYDQIVISNIYELLKIEKGIKLLTEVLNFQYIRFIHDYDGGISESSNLIKEIYRKARKVIFLSPLHKETYCKTFNLPKDGICIPSPININIYRDYGLKRSGVLMLGEVADHKGIDQAYRYLEEKNEEADFYTWDVREETKIGRITYRPAVNQKFIPYLMNTYKKFIHFPKWVEPFGRTIAEAELSGIEVICNKNMIGYYSYNLSTELMRERIKNGLRDF